MDKKVHCILCGKDIDPEEIGEGDPRICEDCWHCPKCGVGARYKDERGVETDGLIIDAFEGDIVICSSCGNAWTAAGFESVMLRKKNRKQCPHCKGVGYIDAEKPLKKKK